MFIQLSQTRKCIPPINLYKRLKALTLILLDGLCFVFNPHCSVFGTELATNEGMVTSAFVGLLLLQEAVGPFLAVPE